MVIGRSKSTVIGTLRFGDTVGGDEIEIGLPGIFEGPSLRDYD